MRLLGHPLFALAVVADGRDLDEVARAVGISGIFPRIPSHQEAADTTVLVF